MLKFLGTAAVVLWAATAPVLAAPPLKTVPAPSLLRLQQIPLHNYLSAPPDNLSGRRSAQKPAAQADAYIRN
jgi:hypothetical protein